MANISFLRWKAHAELIKFQSITKSLSLPVFSSRGVSNSSDPNVKEDMEAEDDPEMIWAKAEEEARLHKLRNVSGLPSDLHRQLHGQVVEPPFKDMKRRRKMLLTYGSQSGDDLRILWPSRQELAAMQAEDREDEVPLVEKIRQMNLEKDEAVKARLDREKMIQKNMSQMSKWISEYHKRVGDAEQEVLKRKEKKEALLDEAREYFGYRVKANDPKFQQMVEEKEERERKEAKEFKKKEKARKLAEKLKQDVLAMKMSSEAEEQKEKPSS